MITVIGLWKMYVKAGRPGWAAIVPVYNWWVWVEIIGRSAMVVLGAGRLCPALVVAIVGIVLSLAMFVLYLLGCLDMAKRFGQGTGYGIGLWLLPFVFAPILGFGSARFEGDGLGYTTPWQAAPENTIFPPPPAPPAAPAPLMTTAAPIGMPPAPAESMPPVPPAPMPAAPAESFPPAPMPVAPAESMPPAPGAMPAPRPSPCRRAPGAHACDANGARSGHAGGVCACRAHATCPRGIDADAGPRGARARGVRRPGVSPALHAVASQIAYLSAGLVAAGAAQEVDHRISRVVRTKGRRGLRLAGPSSISLARALPW